MMFGQDAASSFPVGYVSWLTLNSHCLYYCEAIVEGSGHTLQKKAIAVVIFNLKFKLKKT